MKEFRKLVYEPEHIEGGVCWCGTIFSKETDGKMHINHKEQRDTLSEYILDMVLEKQDELQKAYAKASDEKDEESANTYSWGIAMLNNMFFQEESLKKLI